MQQVSFRRLGDDIIGVLIGAGGKRATVSRLVYIVPGRGSGH
jgi:hypothetical protein